VALARDGQSAQAAFVCSLRRIHSLGPDFGNPCILDSEDLHHPDFAGLHIPAFEILPGLAAEAGR
jgi:hypothetical protein